MDGRESYSYQVTISSNRKLMNFAVRKIWVHFRYDMVVKNIGYGPVVQACNSSTQEAEAGGWRLWRPAWAT
jgi:hypothetical protein